MFAAASKLDGTPHGVRSPVSHPRAEKVRPRGSAVHLKGALSHFAPPVIPDTHPGKKRALAPGEASEVRQPNVRLTDLRREQLVAAYGRGALLKDLAAQFDIDVQTVKRQLKQAGVELRPWPALSDEQIDRMVRDYIETEIPMAKLGQHYGVGYGTVRRAFEARGVQARPRGVHKRHLVIGVRVKGRQNRHR